MDIACFPREHFLCLKGYHRIILIVYFAENWKKEAKDHQVYVFI